jgi:hypothetical protein
MGESISDLDLRIDFEDLQSFEGGRIRIRSFALLPKPVLLGCLWYSVHGENPTRLPTFSDESPGYSAEEEGDSSGVFNCNSRVEDDS